jgi:FKBP-type peptidyl-prolyl cis-trans isomerase
MIKKFVFALLMCLGCGGASAQYETLTNQIQYRICHHDKKGDKVKAGSFVYMRLWGIGPTVVSGERYWMKIEDEPHRNSLHNALVMLSEGDSAEFVLPYALVLKSLVNLPRLKWARTNDNATLRVRILRVVDANIAYSGDYEEFCKQQEQQSQRWVKQFLAEGPAFEKRKSGVYGRTLHSGNGKRGNTMLLTYTGRFLNGVKFDNTPQSGAFRYVKGTPMQMIQGIVTTLAEMSEGAKMQVLIPSSLAFGNKGLADIVPPFAPVVYDIEVVKVDKK